MPALIRFSNKFARLLNDRKTSKTFLSATIRDNLVHLVLLSKTSLSG
jgi:hypothetical protein